MCDDVRKDENNVQYEVNEHNYRYFINNNTEYDGYPNYRRMEKIPLDFRIVTKDIFGDKNSEADKLVTNTYSYRYTGVDDKKTEFSYDVYGNMVEKKEYLNDSEYVCTGYDYTDVQYGGQYSGANLTGQTVYDVADADGSIENVTVSYEYDWRGYPVKFTDANGNITLYEYDAIGRVIKTTFPDGTAETISYNFGGREITKKNALGTGFIYYYDGSGNLEEESINEWSKEIKEYRYDGFNNCIKEIFRSDSDNGKTHKYTYDTLQRPLSKEVYDNAGELIYK